MEHRWSIRQQIEGVVTVVAPPPYGRVQVALQDISLGGVGLRIRHMQLPLNCVVTLVFTLEVGGRLSHHRLAAQVVHRGAQRIGLLFLDAGRELLESLRALGLEHGHDRAAGLAGYSPPA